MHALTYSMSSMHRTSCILLTVAGLSADSPDMDLRLPHTHAYISMVIMPHMYIAAFLHGTVAGDVLAITVTSAAPVQTLSVLTCQNVYVHIDIITDM